MYAKHLTNHAIRKKNIISNPDRQNLHVVLPCKYSSTYVQVLQYLAVSTGDYVRASDLPSHSSQPVPYIFPVNCSILQKIIFNFAQLNNEILFSFI